jgi:hypothetical protein
MQQLIPKQDPLPNPTRTHTPTTTTLFLHILRILQHDLRDDTLPELEQRVVLGALGVQGAGAVARHALAVLGPVGEGVADGTFAVEGVGEDLLLLLLRAGFCF